MCLDCRGSQNRLIQTGVAKYDFKSEVLGHLSRWESLALMGFYLDATWLLHLLPASYYDLEGTRLDQHRTIELHDASVCSV